MKRSELITGLMSLRYKLEKAWDSSIKVEDYDIEVVEEALYTLIDVDT